ncbi:YdhK family protein [Psychrobacillus sp. NPDC093200]|uniref:YdhK family protein n=1 Tax=Psychrobacillus sp. NPDC093200 TaxID=3390656 RepID=UPI003D0519DE
MKRNLIICTILLVVVMIISACASDEKETNTNPNPNNMNMNESSGESMEGMDHSNMDMSGSGEVPDGLKVAENPTFEIGSQAILETDHMSGMKGAEATIVGAYDTSVYVISYTPTTGGKRVENHKWVIQEEIKNAGDQPLKPGTEVTIEADHMAGMEGANAEIDSSEATTVYMVDYISTTDGEAVTNHKWVTESELSAK